MNSSIAYYLRSLKVTKMEEKNIKKIYELAEKKRLIEAEKRLDQNLIVSGCCGVTIGALSGAVFNAETQYMFYNKKSTIEYTISAIFGASVGIIIGGVTGIIIGAIMPCPLIFTFFIVPCFNSGIFNL